MTHAAPVNDQKFSMSLHGARGIAACIVVLGHTANIVTHYGNGFSLPPGLFNASAAVVLFFVMSGIVLSPSALKASAGVSDLTKFYIRRAFRLMPLMIVVNIASGVFVASIHPLLAYQEPLTGPFRVDVFLVGFFGATLKINGPSWSIFIEIVASSLMPFLAVAAASRFRWLWLIAVSAVACVPVSTPYQVQIFLVPFFVGACIPFVVGSREWLRITPAMASVISLGFLLAFNFVRPVAHWMAPELNVNTSPLVVIAETVLIAPVMAIMFLTSWPRLLGAKVFQILGDLSFPLYLLHFNILTLVYNGVRVAGIDEGWVVFMLSAVLTFLITLPLAWLANVYVEVPGIAAGRKVAGFFGARLSPRVS